MKLHRNARLAPKARRLLVHRVRESKWPVRRAASAAGVSAQTAYKWLKRFALEGESGLEDRSSRPRHAPRKTAPRVVERIERLRRRRKTAWEIAQEIGVARSTVSAVLQRLGLGRLWRVVEAEVPAQRYEHARPGSLLHIDAKKLGRIDGVGHRIHGDRHRVGSDLRVHRRLHATRLRRDGAVRERPLCSGLFAPCARLLRASQRAMRTRAHRQRQGLHVERVPGYVPGRRSPASANSALHASHEWQGRALHPDVAATMGLPPSLPNIGTASRRVAALGCRVQSPPSPSSPRHEAADRSPQRGPRTVNNLISSHS